MKDLRPLAYVPGQSPSLDELAERYKALNANTKLAPDAAPAEERSVKDPFGFEARSPAPPRDDPWRRSKVAAEKLLNFLNLLIAEEGLSPDEAFYAQELMSLNTLNAPDVPLSPGRRVEVRKAALAYYEKHRPR